MNETNAIKQRLKITGLWNRNGRISGNISIAALEKLISEAKATGSEDFWVNVNENKFKAPGSNHPDLYLALTPRDMSYRKPQTPTETDPWGKLGGKTPGGESDGKLF